MLKPRMSVSVSMIIILSLQRNWCSGRVKHLLVNVLDGQDTPPFSENGSKEKGQDYQNYEYSNEFQPAINSYETIESSEESIETFNPAIYSDEYTSGQARSR